MSRNVLGIEGSGQAGAPYAEGVRASAGAYTTARTIDGYSVFDLGFHIQRLVDSSRLMMEKDAQVTAPIALAVGLLAYVTVKRASSQPSRYPASTRSD